MNKNVFNYLNEKANEVTDYIKAKAEAAGAYLSEHAQDIKRGAIKGTATVLTAATLLTGMTGCVMQGTPQQGQGNIQGQGTIQTQPQDPNAPSRSESGLFYGDTYKEEELPPTIEHRTDEEIAQTGLTAQDVLNAYDQLAIDVAKAFYTHDQYSALPDEVKNSITAEFESITPWSYFYIDNESGDAVTVTAPFHALNKEFEAKQQWQGYKENAGHIFPAYSTTLNFKTYIDGVCFNQTINNIGVEQNQFEQMLSTFNKESYFMDQTTLLSKIDESQFRKFEQYLYQNVYEPLNITRDLINNATPEQLKSLYAIIESIRSITFDQELPQQPSNEPEM